MKAQRMMYKANTFEVHLYNNVKNREMLLVLLPNELQSLCTYA